MKIFFSIFNNYSASQIVNLVYLKHMVLSVKCSGCFREYCVSFFICTKKTKNILWMCHLVVFLSQVYFVTNLIDTLRCRALVSLIEKIEKCWNGKIKLLMFTCQNNLRHELQGWRQECGHHSSPAGNSQLTA